MSASCQMKRTRTRGANPARAAARGFSLIVTIFVILVLAGLGAFAVRVGISQQQSVNFGLLNARAQAAAGSGIEYAANQALRQNHCPPTPPALTLTAAGLTGFSVTVTCQLSQHTIGPLPPPPTPMYQAYLLTSTAQYGTYGSSDFVQRTLTRSVTNAPASQHTAQ